MPRHPAEGTTEARASGSPDTRTGRVSFGWRIALSVLSVLPHGLISRLAGTAARIELPTPVQALANRAFVRLAGVDVAEAERPPESYPSLSALFVRRLGPGLRSWPSDPSVPASPVDGVLGAQGRLVDGTLFQAKGRTYDAATLLAGEDASRFHGGYFFTLYLSPRHYHRVHAPISGGLTAARVAPGRLFPVNPAAVASIDDLFPRNERLVAILDGGRYEVAVVAVGALNVGSIAATFDPEWREPATGGVTNVRRPGSIPRARRYEPPLAVEQGDELMAFQLGSTVVLLVSAGEGEAVRPALGSGRDVRLGTPLLEPDPGPS